MARDLPGAAQPAPIIRRGRRKHAAHPRHGGAWKVAYADFVTAMMAFFMLLWLLSTPDREKLKGIADYFSASISGPESHRFNPIGSSRSETTPTRPIQADAAKITTTAQPGGPAHGGAADIAAPARRFFADEMRIAIDMPPETPGAPTVKVEPDPRGTRITLMDSARQSLFVGTTARLTPYGQKLIARVAAKLTPTAVGIAIEGHTDASGGDRSPVNWQLSAERALTTRAALVAAGLPPERVQEVVGKAGTQPIYPEQPTRPENRRIAIIALAQQAPMPRDPDIGL